MPTSTDLAQALALRKADPTLTTADAVAQVRSSAVPAPVTPAPVTPVAPMPVAPVTPIAPIGPPAPVAPPPNVNQAQHDANVASRQAQIQAGTIPAVGVNTPAPVAQKADPTPGINPTTSAQANAESEKIKAQNDAQIALETHKSNLTQQSQKQATQQANNALASDEGAILNTMRTGGIVPEAVKSSPYYQTAQQTYNKLQQYANYSTGDMVTAMNQGAILPGTTVYNEMMKDPVMKQKIIDAQVYKNANPAPVQEVYANSANDIVANNPTTASYLADGVITFDEYNKATNNPAVVTKIHDVEVKTNKYNTLKAEYDAIETDTKAEYQNKGGSGAYIDSIIADRQKSKYKNLQLASGEVDTANGTLTQLKSQASNLFETNLKLYEMQRTEQNQIKSEQRQVQSQKDMMQYKSDFEKKQAEIALNDPKTQIQATMDEFEKMGIVSQGNTASKIAEFKTSGKTLPEYISGLRAQFMSKPEYKKAMELKSGALSDSQKLFATQNFEIQKIKLESGYKDKNIQRVGGTTDHPIYGYMDGGKVVQVNGSVSSANAPSAASAKYLDIATGTNVGVQCGTFARQLCGLDATPGGNNLEARVQAFKDPSPAIGGMVLFNGNGYDKTYGHIASIESLNSDGTMNIVESNLKGDNTVTRRTIPATGGGISGFYNNTPLAKSAGGTGTQGLTGVAKIATDIIAGRSKMPTGKEGNAVIEYIANNNLENGQTGNLEYIKTSSVDKQSMASMIKMLDDLHTVKNMPNKNIYTGIWDSWSVKGGLGINDDQERAKLTTILNTNLNNYIKEITGATVGKDEAPRLIATQPTMGQSDTNFNENLDSSIRLLENKLSALTSDYRFDSIDDMRNRVLGTQNTSQSSNTAPSQNDPFGIR